MSTTAQILFAVFGLPGLVLLGLGVPRLLRWLADDPALHRPTPALPVAAPISGWYHVELHGRDGASFSGLIDEVTLGGIPFLRVQEANRLGGFQPHRLLSPKAVYRLTPTTEARCRDEALVRSWIQPMGLEVEDNRGAVFLGQGDEDVSAMDDRVTDVDPVVEQSGIRMTRVGLGEEAALSRSAAAKGTEDGR